MTTATVHCRNQGTDVLVLELSGNWQMEGSSPDPAEVIDNLKNRGCRRLVVDTEKLAAWDSSILTYLLTIYDYSNTEGIYFDPAGLPAGARQLLILARAVPAVQQGDSKVQKEYFLVKVGEEVLDFMQSAREIAEFVGQSAFPLFRLLFGKARFRSSDLALFIQETGAYAVPIVSLISFLFGVILAFVGIMQLKLFGAQVYVADLVGIAVVRVMGAVMTGIIMAGRTGAAFAAQIGTMQVNEEIDALKTLAISPIDYLVLPRLIALTLMMPLLTLYANLMGIAGGAVIASGFYDIKLVVYLDRVVEAVTLNDLFVGLFMGVVFGILVALSGCLRGIQCGRDASAVGDATTSAVVTSIVAIIIATAIIIVISTALGI